jgi:hypothetical protein
MDLEKAVAESSQSLENVLRENLWPYLRKDTENPDRVCTGWGTKTLKGLSETLRRWVEESRANFEETVVPRPTNMKVGAVYYSVDQQHGLITVTVIDVQPGWTAARVTNDQGVTHLAYLCVRGVGDEAKVHIVYVDNDYTVFEPIRTNKGRYKAFVEEG